MSEWNGLRIVSLSGRPAPGVMPWGVTDREGVVLAQFDLHSDALMFRRTKCLDMAIQKTL